MNYTVIYQRVDDPSFPPELFYAHIPVLDLTTQGIGLEGAKQAAIDLSELWIAERLANGESVPIEDEILTGQISIPDAVLGS